VARPRPAAARRAGTHAPPSGGRRHGRMICGPRHRPW
jgi:hypothetical protein